MNLTTIVIKNLRIRVLSTTLTIVSILLGVAMVTAVIVVQSESEKSFNQTSVGYDLIFSAKGSALQVTLNTLYHLETSVGIIPYSLYETLKKDPRVERAFPFYVGDSYNGFRVVGTSSEFIELAEPRRGQPFQILEGRNFEAPLEAVIGQQVAQRTGLRLGSEFVITHGLHEVAPGAEAHTHEEAPVVVVGILATSGTANDRVIFTDLYTTHALHDPHFHADDFHDDHHHENESVEHHSNSSHDHNHSHSHSHLHSHNHSDEELHDHHVDGHSPIKDAIELKELDAVLVKMTNPAAALQVSGMINFPTPENPLLLRNMMRDPLFAYKDQIMAVIPAMQINNLMSIVGNAEVVLRYVSWFVVIVALFGVLIAIYNTMEERKRDLAVMRALGAKKSTIFSIIVMESATICGIGAILGLLSGHLIVSYASPKLAEIAGIVIQAFSVDLTQIYVVLFLILAGIISGTIPAFKAYRSDPIKNLSSGK